MYFRRETGYFGTDNAGFVRFGATDQPTSLFITGTFENFDDGGWNGDPNLGTYHRNAALNWPFPDQGALYTTSKIVYVSPKFANLVDFGVSFAPAPATSRRPVTAPTPTRSAPDRSSTGTGCDAASSTSVAAENQRPRNIARRRGAPAHGVRPGRLRGDGRRHVLGSCGVQRHTDAGLRRAGAAITAWRCSTAACR